MRASCIKYVITLLYTALHIFDVLPLPSATCYPCLRQRVMIAVARNHANVAGAARLGLCIL